MNMVMRRKHQRILYWYFLLLLIDPVILAPSSKNQEKYCGDVSVDDCLRKVQTFFSLAPLQFSSDKSELDELCSNAKEGFYCSTKLLATSGCLAGKDRDLFDSFKNMSEHNIFFAKFCLTGVQTSTKRAYYSYDRPTDNLVDDSECLGKSRDALLCCYKKTGAALEKMSDDVSIESMCCLMANYIKCVDFVIRSNCGDDVANYVAIYLRQKHSGQFEDHCKGTVDVYAPDPEVCTAPVPVCSSTGIRTAPVPVYSSTGIGTFAEFNVLMSLLFIICISYL